MNHHQTSAATSGAPRILVLAGPGSGKTRTLIGRIEHLLDRQGVRPEQINAVTFTNAAAAEMRKRLGRPLGFIGTIHALALRHLRVTIIPDRQRDALLEQEAKRQGFKGSAKLLHETREHFGMVRAGISVASIGRLSPEIRACAVFYAALRADGMADCDSILWDFADHIRTRGLPGVQHVLGDEFQDTGDGDAAVWSALARRAELDLFVVGDPDQAIYGFRGGNVRHITAMASGEPWPSDAPRWERHVLDLNYRSTRTVCFAATNLMTYEPARPAKSCVALPDAAEGRVEFFEERAAMDATARVVNLVCAAHDAGVKSAEIAVLSRTNAEADELAAALRVAGLPVNRPAGKFSGRPARVIRADDARLLASLWLAPDNETLGTLWLMARDPGALDRVRAAKAAGTPLRSLWLPNPPETVAEAGLSARTLLDIPTGEWVADMAALGTAVSVRELAGIIARAEPEWDDSDLSPEDRDGVRVGTIHWSKGQEFHTVIVAGFEEIDGDKPPTAEDRRLAFVALTRAKVTAYFIAARARFLPYRGRVATRMHRFAREMEKAAG